MQILHRSHDYLVIELTQREAALIGGSLHVYNTASEIYLKSVPDGTVELANAFLWQGTLEALHKRRAKGWVTRVLAWIRTRLGRAEECEETSAVPSEGTEAAGASGAEDVSTPAPAATDTCPTPSPTPPCEVVPE